ncbi:MAG TPA: glycoside hydrolase family 3 N-terminal domain-containing protein [Streptosporangiaceae bacterium]|nr:glycoside hydrolase family 3 N-terminal domain-containing protein [Streptosporangiaceae bacterium]
MSTMPDNALSRRGVLMGGVGIAATGLWRTVGQQARPAPHAALTPQQLAGQRVIFSYHGLTPPDSLLEQISSGQAAGVIFFGENISSESQIAAVIGQLNAANAQSPVKAPLLLMTDQEGGIVRRLPGAPTLSEKQVGASSDPVAQAKLAGTGAGQNLAGVGMNVNLAPVLDVFRQAGNFIDEFGRSYSSDPRIVTECGKAMVKAQQAVGPAATAKHFPGLGAATVSQNTDLGPVTLDLSLSDLRSIDERPYHQVIAAGVRLVMCSWAVYPALDPNLPAGLSPAIVQGELRRRLGFRGVTITDALEAGAISAFGTPGQTGVLAAKAGMDVLLASARDVTEGQAVVSGLAGALQSGALEAGSFLAAVGRTIALRLSLA